MTERYCAWIGEGEGCEQSALHGGAYCKVHHDRMYLTLLPEMATYIIEKELSSEELVPFDTPVVFRYNSENKGVL